MHVLTRRVVVVDLVHHLNLELAVVLDQWDPVKDINDLDIWNTEIINIEYTFNWTQLVLLCTNTGTPPPTF